MYGAQRTATRERYSSIVLRYFDDELNGNECDMAVVRVVVRVLAVLGHIGLSM